MAVVVFWFFVYFLASTFMTYLGLNFWSQITVTIITSLAHSVISGCFDDTF
jgi:hypothetical protein